MLTLKNGEKLKIGAEVRLLSGDISETQTPGYALGGRAGEMINLKNEIEGRFEVTQNRK